tara:strand:- start:317 stop:421 length:105 start_codon:yes stop_codon:yes gene_type:complete
MTAQKCNINAHYATFGAKSANGSTRTAKALYKPS